MKLQDAVNKACQELSLVEALTWIAVWENERAIEQAVEFGRTGIRTGSGDAAWDTCFRVCITAVMEAWSIRVPMTSQDQGPPIFDPVRLCQKCGDRAASEYKNEYNRIKRTCKTCGYSWMELPIDFKESGGKDTK